MQQPESVDKVRTGFEAPMAAARQAFEMYGLDNRDVVAHRVKEGASYVFYDKAPPETQVVAKVIVDPDGSEYESATSLVERLLALYESGVPVEKHVSKPKAIGSYIVMLSEFLPDSLHAMQAKNDRGSILNFMRGFGSTLRSLHTVNPDRVDPGMKDMPLPDLLTIPNQTYDKLRTLQEVDNLPRLEDEDIAFTDKHMEKFATLLANGREALEELTERATARDQWSLYHGDVTPFNAMVDRYGRTALIDLQYLSIGPIALDFGRPLGQWWRFGRPDEWAKTMLDSYLSTPSWLPPLEAEDLELASQVALARYAPTLATRLANSALAGQEVSHFLLAETINRLENDFWNSEEDYIKRQS